MTNKNVTYKGSEEMSRTANLMQRNGRWYYNKAFPKDLWSITGKASFRKALRTDSLSEAQRARPEAEREYWRRLDDARRAAAAEAERPLLTNQDAEAIAAQRFREGLSSTEEWMEPARSPARFQSQLEEAADFVADAKRTLAEEPVSRNERNAARSIAEEAGFRVQEGRALECFIRLLRRSSLAFQEVREARLVSDYSARPGDPFFASLMEGPAPSSATGEPQRDVTAQPRRTLADLEAAYKADVFDSLSKSTRTGYAPVLRLLRDVLGPQRNVATITRGDGRHLFDTVKALPKSIGKRKALRGLDVPAAVAEGRRLGLPTLAPKTVNDAYMAFLSAIFAWAKREGWIAENPVKGLRARGDVAAREKRDPFTAAQLKALFSASPWKPRNVSPDGKPIRYWAPLLALFHGMRRGEIAQLQPGDVTEIEGIPAIEVRGQRLKTAASRRTLPVHPELIRLGFLDYAERQRSAGDDMLFSGEKPNGRGQWGDPVGDWFGRLLKRREITGRGLGLHAFRHNFEDRLREAGLHGTAIGAELAGRTKAGIAAAYGRGFSMTQLAQAVEKIAYPGLKIEA